MRTRVLLGRWAALFLVLAPSGGMVVTPALAGSGSMCNYNPALYAKGNTYRVIQKWTRGGKPLYTTEASYKVMGLAIFHGHKAIDVRVHGKTTLPSHNFSSSTTADIFYKIGRKFIYTYGDRSTSGGEVYNDPPIAFPKHLVIDTPYTSKSVVHTSGGGTQSTQTIHWTNTFLGMESITVPAGTFVACKIKTEASSPRVKARLSYSWNVSSGMYAQLAIKGDYLNSATDSADAAQTKMVALVLRFDGK